MRLLLALYRSALASPLGFTFFLLLPFSFAGADEGGSLIFVQPEIGYYAPRVFTQSQTAAFTGLAYGGSVYYRIPMGEGGFSLAPLVSYTVGSFDSTANSSSQTEKFSEKTAAVGLKAYFGNLFFKGSYLWMSGEDKSVGAVNQRISSSSHGYGGSFGYSFSLSDSIAVEVSADVENVTFVANPSGFTSDSQYLRFGGTLGIGILIPSSPARRNVFKTTRTTRSSE